ITRGKISLQKETVRIGDVVERALEQARHLISARHHHLTVSISPAAKAAQVNADPARLQQVIGNLIDNAAKFTPFGGRIELIVTCADQAVIQVRDNGEGIAPEMLPHIFDLFRQADASLDRAHGGLGMGLTLAKQLVEMHHGRLEARSGGRGRGSEFEIRLPLDKGQTRADERAVAPGASLTALRVLIVDDNFDAAESLKALIELLGHQAHIAADGDAALTAIDSAEFKLALVDIGLPGMDGYELARRLRTLRGGAELTLCALTGYSQEEARQRATAAGFDRHFVKPLKIEALETLLAEICQSDRGAVAEVREPAIPHA
ncbi:MAG: hybrid sensor histidine kinase/response regulator, partial [Candidatus Binataceae bacterium]